jgi:hypothetical protein
MPSQAKSTILPRNGPLFAPGELSSNKKRQLFAALEKFANVGDSEHDYLRFQSLYPGFWPIEIQDQYGTSLAWRPRSHRLFLAYRYYLRRVWASDPEALRNDFVGVLLGINHRVLQTVQRASAAEQPTEHTHLIDAWGELQQSYLGGAIMPVLPVAFPDWRRGVLTYLAHNEFQAAVYLLFSESWRAKICTQCGACFVAREPPQLYCSTRCYGKAKRKRDLNWWRKKGAAMRKRYSQKKQDARKDRQEGAD